jgi:hypothetical protein
MFLVILGYPDKLENLKTKVNRSTKENLQVKKKRKRFSCSTDTPEIINGFQEKGKNDIRYISITELIIIIMSNVWLALRMSYATKF